MLSISNFIHCRIKPCKTKDYMPQKKKKKNKKGNLYEGMTLHLFTQNLLGIVINSKQHCGPVVFAYMYWPKKN